MNKAILNVVEVVSNEKGVAAGSFSRQLKPRSQARLASVTVKIST